MTKVKDSVTDALSYLAASKSAILSGEPWTPTMQEMYLAAAGTIDTLRAQLAEAQRDAKLERALQKAAKDLPVNWSIHVAVERNAGWVELLNADGDFEDFEDADRTLAEQVISANDAAKEKKNGS